MIFGKNTGWAKVDCAIVTENMTLACEALGMASCIIGEVTWIDKELIHKNIKAPEGYELVLGLSAGYAKKPNKTKRKINNKKFSVIK